MLASVPFGMGTAAIDANYTPDFVSPSYMTKSLRMMWPDPELNQLVAGDTSKRQSLTRTIYSYDSELSNSILGTLSRGDKRVRKCIPGKKATLINVSISNGDLILNIIQMVQFDKSALKQ